MYSSESETTQTHSESQASVTGYTQPDIPDGIGLSQVTGTSETNLSKTVRESDEPGQEKSEIEPSAQRAKRR